MNDQIYKNWRKDVGTDYETTRKLVDEDYTRANISRNTENELVEMNKKLTGATAMNERIKELYKQAFGYFPPPTGEPELEKFAELIREDIMQELFINGYEDAFDHLNEYFGDEE